MVHSLEPNFILPEDYRAFGRIVQAFVQVEDFYTGIIENITGVPNGTAFFLLSITGYDGVKNLLKTIISDLAVPDDQRKAGLALMDNASNEGAR